MTTPTAPTAPTTSTTSTATTPAVDPWPVDLFDWARDLATRPGTRRPSGNEWR